MSEGASASNLEKPSIQEDQSVDGGVDASIASKSSRCQDSKLSPARCDEPPCSEDQNRADDVDIVPPRTCSRELEDSNELSDAQEKSCEVDEVEVMDVIQEHAAKSSIKSEASRDISISSDDNDDDIIIVDRLTGDEKEKTSPDTLKRRQRAIPEDVNDKHDDIDLKENAADEKTQNEESIELCHHDQKTQRRSRKHSKKDKKHISVSIDPSLEKQFRLGSFSKSPEELIRNIDVYCKKLECHHIPTIAEKSIFTRTPLYSCRFCPCAFTGISPLGEHILECKKFAEYGKTCRQLIKEAQKSEPGEDLAAQASDNITEGEVQQSNRLKKEFICPLCGKVFYKIYLLCHHALRCTLPCFSDFIEEKEVDYFIPPSRQSSTQFLAKQYILLQMIQKKLVSYYTKKVKAVKKEKKLKKELDKEKNHKEQVPKETERKSSASVMALRRRRPLKKNYMEDFDYEFAQGENDQESRKNSVVAMKEDESDDERNSKKNDEIEPINEADVETEAEDDEENLILAIPTRRTENAINNADQRSYTCPYCKHGSFDTPIELGIHVFYTHKETWRYLSDEDEHTLLDQLQYIQRLAKTTFTQTPAIRCTMCNVKFYTLYNFGLHLSWCSHESPAQSGEWMSNYCCPKCNARLNLLSGLLEHLLEVHFQEERFVKFFSTISFIEPNILDKYKAQLKGSSTETSEPLPPNVFNDSSNDSEKRTDENSSGEESDVPIEQNAFSFVNIDGNNYKAIAERGYAQSLIKPRLNKGSESDEVIQSSSYPARSERNVVSLTVVQQKSASQSDSCGAKVEQADSSAVNECQVLDCAMNESELPITNDHVTDSMLAVSQSAVKSEEQDKANVVDEKREEKGETACPDDEAKDNSSQNGCTQKVGESTTNAATVDKYCARCEDSLLNNEKSSVNASVIKEEPNAENVSIKNSVPESVISTYQVQSTDNEEQHMQESEMKSDNHQKQGNDEKESKRKHNKTSSSHYEKRVFGETYDEYILRTSIDISYGEPANPSFLVSEIAQVLPFCCPSCSILFKRIEEILYHTVECHEKNVLKKFDELYGSAEETEKIKEIKSASETEKAVKIINMVCDEIRNGQLAQKETSTAMFVAAFVKMTKLGDFNKRLRILMFPNKASIEQKQILDASKNTTSSNEKENAEDQSSKPINANDSNDDSTDFSLDAQPEKKVSPRVTHPKRGRRRLNREAEEPEAKKMKSESKADISDDHADDLKNDSRAIHEEQKEPTLNAKQNLQLDSKEKKTTASSCLIKLSCKDNHSKPLLRFVVKGKPTK